jgi:hypothetical protein
MYHDDENGEKVWKRKDACHIESDRIYYILRKSPFYNVLDDRICHFWVHIAVRSLDDRGKSNVLLESTMNQDDGIGVKTGNGKIIRSDLENPTKSSMQVAFFNAWEDRICHFGVHIAVVALRTIRRVLFCSNQLCIMMCLSHRIRLNLLCSTQVCILHRVGRSDLSFLGPHSSQQQG